MESFYKYVGELEENVAELIKNTHNEALELFNITDSLDNESVAEQVRFHVDNIISSGIFPEKYGNIEDAAVALGVLFGQTLCDYYGWKWMSLGQKKDTASVFVVSPENYFCHPPMYYIQRIINGKNLGEDGRNHNNIIENFKRFSDVDSQPNEKKYFPLI